MVKLTIKECCRDRKIQLQKRNGGTKLKFPRKEKERQEQRRNADILMLGKGK